ncbi:MAG: amino acid permease [Acidobacteriaceae bacterium]|nr:amino acid permease [Acidobacteriaceae bacterium]MBV9780913.1 amino acid permease [Acidobacteriaceae bacterium]
MRETKTEPSTPPPVNARFHRSLGLFDSLMIVIGVMIGSGIFIVPAEMARIIGSPGWLLVAWIFTGILTIAAALSYGELASMMPEAGGMYVYLREAFSPVWGFLYGWTLFTVIQTGTIAAVSVAFARFLGLLWPAIAEDRYLISPVHISAGYAVSLSSAQLIAIVVIILLTWTNVRGVDYGKLVQNLFTTAKLAALFGLIVIGFLFGWNKDAVAANWGAFWTPHNFSPVSLGVSAASAFGLLAAICVSQSGSLFSADSWHDVTFAGAEVRNPRRTLPLALAGGTTIVIAIYLLANLAYLVTLPLSAIQHAPADRVGTAMLNSIFPRFGSTVMAMAIMISTFGCVNSLVLAGPRVYYAMARDGLFFSQVATLNRAGVPGRSLLIQCIWSAALVLPRTFNAATGQYGNVYNNLLEYVISAALIFYIATIAGVIRLRRIRPGAERAYRTPGYPIVPALYILGASAVLLMLFVYRPATTWPGLFIMLAGLSVFGLMKRKI